MFLYKNLKICERISTEQTKINVIYLISTLNITLQLLFVMLTVLEVYLLLKILNLE